MDPVLAQQAAMNGGGPPADMSPISEVFNDAVDMRVPRVVGGMVIGGVAVLVALRAAGIRFSFGAKIGGAA